MPLRYRVRPFEEGDAADPQSLLEEIGMLANVSYNARSDQWAEIVAHLYDQGVRTLLIQERVRDADFTAEYEAFYAKQQRDMPRFCIRVHAFRVPTGATSDDAKEVLRFIDNASSIPDSYLGFVTLRPLRHAPIGATILVDDPQRRSWCRDRFPVHIAGSAFEVEGTPYLQQENAVAACAQASIWMALRTLRKRFGSSAFSPAELTVAATRYVAVDRVFPGRRGLRVEQMLSAIQESDHDPLVIPVREKPDVPPNPYEVMESVQPYIESGLPAIMLLQHSSGGHAVVAIGLASGTLMSKLPPGLIVHNDNEGPYKVLPYSPHGEGFALNQCMTVIVPLPRGISMSAREASKRSGDLFGGWLRTLAKDPASVTLNDNLWTRTYLCTRHAFRAWAKSDAALDPAAAEYYRTAEMPRYVWVTEFHDAGMDFDPLHPENRTRMGEIVLDAGADVFHGDDLLFLRLGKQMLREETRFAGLLRIADPAGSVPLGTSELTQGISEPWDHL